MNEADRRKYLRVVINAFVRFYEESVNPDTQEYWQGVVKDYSEGGMAVVTAHPLPKGSVVTIELPIETESSKLSIVQVRGVVRWVQRLPERWKMGVEFFEFKDSTGKSFAEWMAMLQ